MATFRIIRSSDIGRCPKLSMSVHHYNDDGTCKCSQRDDIKAKVEQLRAEKRQLQSRADEIIAEIRQLEKGL